MAGLQVAAAEEVGAGQGESSWQAFGLGGARDHLLVDRDGLLILPVALEFAAEGGVRRRRGRANGGGRGRFEGGFRGGRRAFAAGDQKESGGQDEDGACRPAAARSRV